MPRSDPSLQSPIAGPADCEPLPSAGLRVPAKVRDITRDQLIERAVERATFGANDFVK